MHAYITPQLYHSSTTQHPRTVPIKPPPTLILPSRQQRVQYNSAAGATLTFLGATSARGNCGPESLGARKVEVANPPGEAGRLGSGRRDANGPPRRYGCARASYRFVMAFRCSRESRRGVMKAAGDIVTRAPINAAVRADRGPPNEPGSPADRARPASGGWDRRSSSQKELLSRLYDNQQIIIFEPGV